jgi:hypothetical protein
MIELLQWRHSKGALNRMAVRSFPNDAGCKSIVEVEASDEHLSIHKKVG